MMTVPVVEQQCEQCCIVCGTIPGVTQGSNGSCIWQFPSSYAGRNKLCNNEHAPTLLIMSPIVSGHVKSAITAVQDLIRMTGKNVWSLLLQPCQCDVWV